MMTPLARDLALLVERVARLERLVDLIAAPSGGYQPWPDRQKARRQRKNKGAAGKNALTH